MDLTLILTILGWAGALCSVSSYGMLTAGRMSANSWTFQGLNIAGSAMLGASALISGAWSSAAVSAIWALIGIQALVLLGRKALASRAVPRLHVVESPAEVLADTLVLDVIPRTGPMPLAG